MSNLAKTLLVASIMAVGASVAQAQYASGDLLLNFRPDSPSGSSIDMTIDIGQFSALQANQVVATVDLTSLASGVTGGSIDNIDFSVLGATSRTGTGPSTYAETMFATEAQVGGTGNSQGTEAAWVNKTYSSLNNAASKIAGITQGLNVADSSSTSYHSVIGTGAFGSSFQGDVEQTTGTGFAQNATGVAADLFFLNTKTTGASTYEGTFTLENNGEVVYDMTAVPEPATFGILAAAGLLMVSVRRQFRKQS